MDTENKNQIVGSIKVNKNNQKRNLFIILVIFICFFVFLINLDGSDDTKTKNNQTQEITVSDNDREIYYKYYEYFEVLTEPLNERHKEGISLTAKYFNKTDEEIEKIYQAITKGRPTDKEIEIYEALETALDQAIDNAKNGNVDEDAINKKIAGQYNISESKLKAIYILVLANDDYQNERNTKNEEDDKEKNLQKITEFRKTTLSEYISTLEKANMGGYINSVRYKTNNTNECSIVITVKNTWHVQNKQLRLQAAQNLWKLWTNLYTMADSKDDCLLYLIDLNGNSVGGSSFIGGSVIKVQD